MDQELKNQYPLTSDR